MSWENKAGIEFQRRNEDVVCRALGLFPGGLLLPVCDARLKVQRMQIFSTAVCDLKPWYMSLSCKKHQGLPVFKSQLHHVVAKWSWAIGSTLSISFLSHKMGIIICHRIIVADYIHPYYQKHLAQCSSNDYNLEIMIYNLSVTSFKSQVSTLYGHGIDLLDCDQLFVWSEIE